MPTKSIYQRQCPQMAEVFDRAGSPRSVLIVPLDFAKDKHLGLMCNGAGDQLLKAFPIHNNRAGLEHLLERIQTTCKRHGISPKNVVVGGEDKPAYAENFLYALHSVKNAPLVVRVNAWKAKKQRENLQASTDSLDLTGVAKTLINRDAYLVFDQEGPHAEEYAHQDALRAFSRTRDSLVKVRTAVSNRIHNEVKLLFPGFLDAEKNNPVSPFSKASLTLMARVDFHAGAFARKRPDSLAKILAKHRLSGPRKKAEALINRARQALPPRPESIESRQQCLQQLICAYQQLEAFAGKLQEFSAQTLARTPAAMLTSISGIGVVTASALGGEQGHVGHVDHLGPLRHMTSYAGIVPGHDQTGGPDKPGIDTKVKRRCNRRLKKHLVHATFHMGTRIGPPEFIRDYGQLKGNGQHADFVMARRLLEMTKAMMRHRFIYLPPDLRGKGRCDRDRLLDYLQETWPKLLAKWRDLRALDEAFATDAPLGIWRECLRNLYGIELPLDSTPPYRVDKDKKIGTYSDSTTAKMHTSLKAENSPT